MANKTFFKNPLVLLGLGLLYVILVFVCEFIGFISPWCWILYPALAAVVAAWPVFKAIRRNGGKGIFLIIGIIFVLTCLLEIGWNTVPTIITGLVIAVVAEFLHYILGYGSKKALRIAYPVFSFVPFAGIFSLWTQTARYAQTAAEEVGQAYGEQISHMGNAWTLATAVVVIAAMALLAVKIFYKES